MFWTVLLLLTLGYQGAVQVGTSHLGIDIKIPPTTRWEKCGQLVGELVLRNLVAASYLTANSIWVLGVLQRAIVSLQMRVRMDFVIDLLLRKSIVPSTDDEGGNSESDGEVTF